jgi:glycerol-3-phosphate dehydrogenase
MAEDLFEIIEEKQIFPNIKREKHYSRKKYIIGLKKKDWNDYLDKQNIKLDEDITDHLYQQYGKGAMKIIEMIQENPSLAERLIKENNFIKAEIIYTLKFELTPHLIDVLFRRTEIFLWIDHRKAPEVANLVAGMMQKEYSWDEERKLREVNHYLEFVRKSTSFLS